MATQGLKRSAPEDQSLLEDVKAVVVDVEGTTTPITFVKETLFPYVRENAKTYLETHWETEECQNDIKALKEQAIEDKDIEGFVEIVDGEKENVLDSLVKNILWQMDQDRKSTALKQLQGHIWREAYKSGKIAGKVFDDVAPALREWISEKRKVYVYSSGSVEAQKLLFGYSDCGSLSELFSGNFDTKTGGKCEKESYSKIAEEVGANPNEVLFLTDMPNEAGPASEAGMKTCLVVREGNQPLTDEEKMKFNVVESFTELTSGSGEAPAKKAEVDQNGDSVGSAEADDVQTGDDDDDDEAEVIDDDEDDDDIEEVDGDAAADSTENAD